ncbi:hypothetical protein BC332_24374 [Capsicum chinense]|nr:hypothetical protein BC332_24374 [Capsicum chinense]
MRSNTYTIPKETTDIGLYYFQDCSPDLIGHADVRGAVKLQLPLPKNVDAVTLDPNPHWTFDALLVELNSIEKENLEALDDHLTTIQRDHKHRSQIEERRIRDDAAREEAKRKEQASQEEKARQGSEQKPRFHTAEKVGKEKAAALEAERKAAKEATAAAAVEKSPESLTTVPSEASKVSRDVTSKPARSISDWQKHSAGLTEGFSLMEKITEFKSWELG